MAAVLDRMALRPLMGAPQGLPAAVGRRPAAVPAHREAPQGEHQLQALRARLALRVPQGLLRGSPLPRLSQQVSRQSLLPPSLRRAVMMMSRPRVVQTMAAPTAAPTALLWSLYALLARPLNSVGPVAGAWLRPHAPLLLLAAPGLVGVLQAAAWQQRKHGLIEL